MSVSRTRRGPLLLPLLMLAVACSPGPGAATPTATGGATASAGASPSTGSPSSPSAPASAGASPTTSGAASGTLTVYSGRSEELVGPVIEAFEKASGVDVQVKYGDSAELGGVLLEEGEASRADLFFSQDAGALGAVDAAGLLGQVPDPLLQRVPAEFRSQSGAWVGVTGRARVLAYDSDTLKADALPASVLELTDPKWKGKIGWAPTNASFQAFVTALRKLKGEEAARAWLEGMKANETKTYEGNAPIVLAIDAGEIQLGLVNHYYVFQQRAKLGRDLSVGSHFFAAGDPGALVNVAGAGILETARNRAAAEAFLDYLLGPDGQRYFAEETFEYPLVEGVAVDPGLTPLAEIQSPELDLSALADLQATLQLLQDVGIL